ncbi:hypothetical protein [Ferrimonas senticii]|uniref:hypothetical protein n=1 Tax=Ferrimonas senticii TaxID=394566 RepID=UPI00042018CD|nr:hypothetical protein [Ferrimonas senticii]
MELPTVGVILRAAKEAGWSIKKSTESTEKLALWETEFGDLYTTKQLQQAYLEGELF